MSRAKNTYVKVKISRETMEEIDKYIFTPSIRQYKKMIKCLLFHRKYHHWNERGSVCCKCAIHIQFHEISDTIPSILLPRILKNG